MDEPAFDISDDDFGTLLDFAESVGGSLAVTGEGRLIVYGLKDAPAIVKAQPFEQFFLSEVNDTTLAFKF